MKSKPDLKLGHVGSALDQCVKSYKKYHLNTLEGRVVIKSSHETFYKMFISMKSRGTLRLGQVGLNARYQGQILEKKRVYIVEGIALIQSL